MGMILELILLGIVKILPAKLAMPLIAGALLLLGWGTFAWHGHLAAQVNLCNSPSGRFSQLFNGSQTANCGLDSLLSLGTLIVGIGLIVLALVPSGVWVYQLTHPDFDLKGFADEVI
jgi:hypothetical protein